MTSLNLNWVKENFNKENFTFFDIGADTLRASISICQLGFEITPYTPTKIS